MSDFKKGQTVFVKIGAEFKAAKFLAQDGRWGQPIVELNGKKMMRKAWAEVPQPTTKGKASKGSGGSRRGSAKQFITLPPPPSDLKRSRFTVDQRFGFIERVTRMVTQGESKSVIIFGPGGLGKTFTVLSELLKAGLKEIEWVKKKYNAPEPEEDEDLEEGEEPEESFELPSKSPLQKKGDYEIVKGYSTPKALYRTLYENRNQITIFDDCDSVWQDPTAVSLLKAALDSYETRRIHWNAEDSFGGSDLPRSFIFKGKIIFISNLHPTQLDEAVVSRCLYVDVSMTAQEKIDRLKTIMPGIRPEVTMSMKREVLTILNKFKDDTRNLNIRTFLNILEIRHANKKHDWEDLAEYMLTAM